MNLSLPFIYISLKLRIPNALFVMFSFTLLVLLHMFRCEMFTIDFFTYLQDYSSYSFIYAKSVVIFQGCSSQNFPSRVV